MKSSIKIAILILVSILLASSAYAMLFFGSINQIKDSKEQTKEPADTLSPIITSSTGDATIVSGSTITILATFSDDIGVISAKMFYKPAVALAWSSKSILTGRANISPPSESNESWYYYVTVDDAAGNGPVGDPSTDGSLYYIITVINDASNTPDDNDSNGGAGNSTQNYSRFVFVELGTKIVCSECPKISVILNDLYKSGNYPFYYVSLPLDNPKALERLTEYNILGYPTVYIDGGFKVLVGSNIQKSDFGKNITSAAARTTPKIFVETTAYWNNHTNLITVNIVATNQETSGYSGHLRVYITEIISTKWQGGTPQHFSFLDFLMNQDIQIPEEGNISFTKTMNASGLDPEDLMIFTVIFNAEKHAGYSQLPNNNPFDAHYVDAVAATQVIQGGNLPPEVGIQNPLVKYVHRFGKPVRKTMTGKTILLGRTTVVAAPHDDSKIVKVEFYVNTKLMATVTQEPYEWSWHTFTIGKRTISVKAYDDSGKMTIASIAVIAFMF
ncbi:MAG TPA: Ig-like domain-containing protein [Candidatus Thermoplasmatota archaeon]|nr:Ig-like domain-containing protein [Candidatus Thermoplasmatota archaeon]